MLATLCREQRMADHHQASQIQNIIKTSHTLLIIVFGTQQPVSIHLTQASQSAIIAITITRIKNGQDRKINTTHKFKEHCFTFTLHIISKKLKLVVKTYTQQKQTH